VKEGLSIKDDVVTVTYSGDSQATIDQNAIDRNSKTSFERFKAHANLVHVGRVDEAFIMQMRCGQCCPDGYKYDLLSPDKEEWRKALLHIQSAHPRWLTVSGKPIAKKKVIWN